MNSSSTIAQRPSGPSGARPPTRRPLIFALIFFLLGIALTVAWFEYGKSVLTGQSGPGLSGRHSNFYAS